MDILFGQIIPAKERVEITDYDLGRMLLTILKTHDIGEISKKINKSEQEIKNLILVARIMHWVRYGERL